MIFTLGTVALPGTSGFVGEFLALVGAYQVSPYTAALAVTGVFLGAAYMLVLYRRVFFGPVTNPLAGKIHDTGDYENTILAILALAVIVLGVFPSVVMERVSPSVELLVENYHSDIAAGYSGGADGI
jgi:NADH-quinone oxidoreductase subunit M